MNIDRDKLIEMAIQAGFSKPNGAGLSGESDLDESVYDAEYPVGEILAKFADLVSAHAITSMQPSEALNERNKLGYAVADVIGKLDEINGQAQECELDDITQIAIPLEIWNELQEALENMPARAESFTSMQGDTQLFTNTDGWVRVEDALPPFIDGKDISENVLGICDGEVNVFNRYYEPDVECFVWCRAYRLYRGLHDAECEFDDEYDVTHWMPIPKPIAISQEKGESV